MYLSIHDLAGYLPDKIWGEDEDKPSIRKNQLQVLCAQLPS